MENKKFELTDDMLDTVTGGAGILEEAAAEDMYVGRIINSECCMCGNPQFKVIDIYDTGRFRGMCTKCGYKGYNYLKAYGGKGWELA